MALGGPGSIADTLSAANSDTIMEWIGTQTMCLIRDKMPLFSDVILDEATEYTSSGPEGYGRDYKAIRTYYGSLAGTIESAGNRNFFNVGGDPVSNVGSRLQRGTRAQEWPDALASASGQAFRMATTLHSHLINLPITAAELRMDANPANIRQFLDKKLMGLPRQVLLRLSNEFFSDSDGTLCTFDGEDTASTTTTTDTSGSTEATVTFRPKEGVMSRFEIGQEVDIYLADSGADLDGADGTAGQGRINSVATTGARVEAWVEFVDPIKEQVRIVFNSVAKTLKAQPGDANGFDNTNTYHVTLANHNNSGTANKIYGWKDWLVPGGSSTASDNYILRGKADATDRIDVDVHGEFRTPYFSNVGALSRTKLMDFMNTIMRYNQHYDYTLDTALISHGIQEHMISQLVSILRRDDGRPLGLDNFAPDTSKMVLPYGSNGANLDVFVSDTIEAGTMVCLKRKGNWRLSTIPEGGAGRAASVPGANGLTKLPIYSPLIGSNTLYRPVHSSSGNYTQQTEHYDMPLYTTFQVEPTEQIPGAVLTGITDSREFGDDGPITF